MLESGAGAGPRGESGTGCSASALAATRSTSDVLAGGLRSGQVSHPGASQPGSSPALARGPGAARASRLGTLLAAGPGSRIRHRLSARLPPCLGSELACVHPSQLESELRAVLLLVPPVLSSKTSTFPESDPGPGCPNHGSKRALPREGLHLCNLASPKSRPGAHLLT